MRIQRCAPLALAFMMAAGLTLRAADQGEVQAIIDKSIKAHGGEEKLAKLKAVTMRFKGTVQTMGMAIPFSGEIVIQGSDQTRTALDVEVNGQKITIVNVLNRKKGWNKVDDNTTDMTPEQLTEAQEGALHNYVTMLAPLKNKTFTLASLGEVQVENRPALGIRVSSKGHRDVNLYFDKDTYLLVKTDTRVKDEESGMEVNQETIYGDFKEIDGIKESMKIAVKKDGKPFVEGTVEHIKREEKLDDSIFAKP
jgi:hypothetical protein